MRPTTATAAKPDAEDEELTGDDRVEAKQRDKRLASGFPAWRP